MIFRKLFYYPGPLWMLYSVFAFFVGVVGVILWGVPLLISIFAGFSEEVKTRFVSSWCRFVVWTYRIRYEVDGRENHDPMKPSLIVSNHQSLLDIPAAYVALAGNIRMVAKKELFSIPFFGYCITKVGFIPIDRGNRSSGKQATNEIADRIHRGLHVWVAPEGTRSTTRELLPFKKGSFAVAIDAQIPVQPLLIENSFEACPKGSLLVRPGVVIRVHVLPRISTLGVTVPQRGEFAEKVRSQMLKELQSRTV